MIFSDFSDLCKNCKNNPEMPRVKNVLWTFAKLWQATVYNKKLCHAIKRVFLLFYISLFVCLYYITVTISYDDPLVYNL